MACDIRRKGNDMSEQKHTPGPWEVIREGRQTMHLSIQTSDEGQKVTLARVYVWGDEKEANARLIAAAPELLAALQFARSVIKSGEGWTMVCEEFINAAIAKATEAS